MKLTNHVNFIGVQNPAMRTFDIIMRTEYGTSYNSYLIKGKEYAIIETVHEDFIPEFLELIEEEVSIKKIKYVILNHTEPDHSGSLKKLIELNPDILVYGTSAAIKNLSSIMNIDFHSKIVKQGDRLDLGNGVVLEFIVAPNLHWPDSMFTYLEADKTLFTCDFFGCHFCEPMVLDRHIKAKDMYYKELKNYYDCIFSPFKKFVNSGMDKIEDLDIEFIATSHGPVLEEMIPYVKEKYREWSVEQKEHVDKKVAIFYVSAYGYTRKMAKLFKDTFEQAGIHVKCYDMLEHPMEEMAKEMNEADAVLFGSPTINRDALRPIWDLIAMTEVISVKNKPALVFGSYGWSGEACKLLVDRLNGIKYNVFGEGVRCVFNPSECDIENIKEAAMDFLQLL
ncbi:MAG TPA: FprA family A-type flavoprotein [Candidatus Merdenecus merdavium]|nr:FprA family A-type flavoprotein [Candidatus Merdenecus merdavium]